MAGETLKANELLMTSTVEVIKHNIKSQLIAFAPISMKNNSEIFHKIKSSTSDGKAGHPRNPKYTSQKVRSR